MTRSLFVNSLFIFVFGWFVGICLHSCVYCVYISILAVENSISIFMVEVNEEDTGLINIFIYYIIYMLGKIIISVHVVIGIGPRSIRGKLC